MGLSVNNENTPISSDALSVLLNQAPRPIIEDFPQHKQTAIEYDYIPNSGEIIGGIGTSFLIHVPYREYKVIQESHWLDQNRYQDFMFQHVPLIKSYTVGQ